MWYKKGNDGYINSHEMLIALDYCNSSQLHLSRFNNFIVHAWAEIGFHICFTVFSLLSLKFVSTALL